MRNCGDNESRLGLLPAVSDFQHVYGYSSNQKVHGVVGLDAIAISNKSDFCGQKFSIKNEA